MKRFLLLILLFASTARANYWTRTNDINGLALNPSSLTGTVGAVRYTTYATDGGPAKDLSGLIAWGEITDRADNYRRQGEGVVLSATGGVAIAIDSLAAGTYTWRIMAGSSTNDSIAFPIAWETIVITNPPSAGGGGSVTVVVSNQHMSSLRADGSPTGKVAVSRADGGVDLLPWSGGTSGGSGGIVSNVTEGTANSWDAGTGSLIINTNPPSGGATQLIASVGSSTATSSYDAATGTLTVNNAAPAMDRVDFGTILTNLITDFTHNTNGYFLAKINGVLSRTNITPYVWATNFSDRVEFYKIHHPTANTNGATLLYILPYTGSGTTKVLRFVWSVDATKNYEWTFLKSFRYPYLYAWGAISETNYMQVNWQVFHNNDVYGASYGKINSNGVYIADYAAWTPNRTENVVLLCDRTNGLRSWVTSPYLGHTLAIDSDKSRTDYITDGPNAFYVGQSGGSIFSGTPIDTTAVIRTIYYGVNIYDY